MITDKSEFAKHIIDDVLFPSKFSDEEKEFIAQVAWYAYTCGKVDALDPDAKSCIFAWKDNEK